MLDFFSFYFFRLHQFESNPIFLATKSIFAVFLLKMVILGAISYSLVKYCPKKTHLWSFLYVFITVYAILGQGIGAYSNFATAYEYSETVGTPQEIQPLPPEQAKTAYYSIYMLTLYLPMFISLISFAIWERIYLKSTFKT